MTKPASHTILVHAQRLAICRLAADAPIPSWAVASAFFTVSRTREELSVVCEAHRVPAGVRASAGWRALQLRGPFALDEVGVLLTMVAPMADAAVSVFPIATFDTDYLLVPEAQLDLALSALAGAGHSIEGPADSR